MCEKRLLLEFLLLCLNRNREKNSEKKPNIKTTRSISLVQNECSYGGKIIATTTTTTTTKTIIITIKQ